MKRVVVIGGGASGLLAAYASANGNSVLLVEKNEKLGKKIYITGKGRCNLTNDCLPDEFLQNVVRGAKFLTGAIYSFPPSSMMQLLEEHGLALKTERGNRVFPMSDHASDVTKTLERACRERGVTFRFNEEVQKIEVKEGQVCAVVTQTARYECDCALVCTGGVSYASTGSTGDGYRFASEVGHEIVSPVPSLVGLNIKGMSKELQGISLKNVVLTVKRGGKVLFSQLGELLFTHYGVSGPLVLSVSALVNRIPLQEITLSIDCKPALDEDKLDARLVRDFTERANEQMKNVARGLLPQALANFVLEKAGIPLTKKANSVTKEERIRLTRALKKLVLQPTALRGFEEAVVTSGGVSLKEINPKTMESKRCKGLYFCGETLDLDAFTGGFNLQIAFSTGYMAGKSIN